MGVAGHQHRSAAELRSSGRRAERPRPPARRPRAAIDILDFPDARIDATLDARRQIIRLIRRFRPDLLITHRPADYHPTTAYTAQLVPGCGLHGYRAGVCPEVPHLQRNPVILYVSDTFKNPVRSRPTRRRHRTRGLTACRHAALPTRRSLRSGLPF